MNKRISLTQRIRGRFRRQPAAPRATRRHQLERLENRQLMTADIVYQWNDAALDAIRAESTSPPVAARALAILHTAVADAVSSISKSFRPYEFEYIAPPTASKEAAVTAAAETVLQQLFPTQVATFTALRTSLLNDIPDGPNEDAGVLVGELAADAVLTLRGNDGSTSSVTYTPGTDPGDWQPTPPANAPALLPQWPNVTPFVLTTADQFTGQLSSNPIPALTSPEYTAAYNEVRAIGAVDSVTRTATQTQIAQFWANGPGTSTPPGHLNTMARVVAEQRNLNIDQASRMFAQLNLALADTAIAVWDVKYDTDFWRPVTAIRAGDTDTNNDTVGDATWTPLIVTPPFSAYVSGHSAFSGAAAAVLRNFFGTDNVTFTFESESGLIAPRTFTSFTQAAEESALSRLYGGVHWSFDNTAGLVLGQAIGNHVSQQALRNEAIAVPVGINNGVLTIHGSERSEKIQVILKGDRLEVTFNGRSRGRFALSQIQSISVSGSGGNDVIELIGRITTPASIDGGSGNDRIVGGEGDDVIMGGSGNDNLTGGRGNDWLNGGTGNDHVRGGIGDDMLLGGTGNDKLYGDAGADTMEGDEGQDQLFGGIGNDVMSGGNGDDRLYGGSGHDTLSGDDGNDILHGDAGTDSLFGGIGNDQLYGAGTNDLLDGGPGNNRLRR